MTRVTAGSMARSVATRLGELQDGKEGAHQGPKERASNTGVTLGDRQF